MLLPFVSKKVPAFKVSVTLSNLNRFSKFLHCWEACEIWYKTTHHHPPHLRHVATLPWDIKIQLITSSHYYKMLASQTVELIQSVSWRDDVRVISINV